MIKTLVAQTSEVDDFLLATSILKEQLGMPQNLARNSIGLVSCHYEFILSGAAKAICEAMPFETVGIVTISQTIDSPFYPTEKSDEPFVFTLTVMTSDDAMFEVASTSDELLTDPHKAISKAYTSAHHRQTIDPSLLLLYAPFTNTMCGDDYVTCLDEVSGKLPIFGTIAIDDTDTTENGFVIINGDHYIDRLAVVFVYTHQQPRFFTASLSKEKILPKSAVVTKSEGNLVMEVNGHHVQEYFSSLGLASASEMQYGMVSLPFLIDYKDGSPLVSRVFISRTPENFAVCSGIVPEGAVIHIGFFDKDDVLLTTGSAIEKALGDNGDCSLFLIYSCVSRSMSLGSDSNAELNMVRDMLHDKLPFMMSYSGGEICPTQVSQHIAINRFHNNTIIICAL